MGVPEDIGVRANLGRAGARDGWAAFLPAFAAMQSNASLRGEDVVLLGHVAVDDLMERAERDGYATIPRFSDTEDTETISDPLYNRQSLSSIPSSHK